jgi:hypothetical protein
MISPKRVGRSVRSRTRRSKDLGLDRRRDTHAALSDFEGQLEDAEETAGWDSDGGEAQFTEEALPGFLADLLLPLRPLKTSRSRSFRWGGSSMVLRTASTSQPRRRVEVQDPSFTSLDSERGPEFVG